MPAYCTTVCLDDAKDGGHAAMDLLLLTFPECRPDDLNFCLFSTSGVHGSYQTIEEAWSERPWRNGTALDKGEAWKSHGPWVTYLLIQPRTVTTTYGNVRMRDANDYRFLKKLRDRSLAVIAAIGK